MVICHQQQRPSILYTAKFELSKSYPLFHGDLQFDNVIYNENQDKFYYIDWRESFADNTEGGDIYYDLAKIYGGILINYYEIKSTDIFILEKGDSIVNFEIKLSQNLLNFKSLYENWLDDSGYDLEYVKYITGIIFLNMSPIHEGKFSQILWFKSIEMLANANK